MEERQVEGPVESVYGGSDIESWRREVWVYECVAGDSLRVQGGVLGEDARDGGPESRRAWKGIGNESKSGGVGSGREGLDRN